MTSPTEIWLYYQQSFITTISQASTQRQIENYYYRFLEYLSTQNHPTQGIEAMIPMIKHTMSDVIKKKFCSPEQTTATSVLPVIDAKSPIITGRPDDRITFETDLRTYSKLIKWIAKENASLDRRLSRNVTSKSDDKDTTKMWIRAVR